MNATRYLPFAGRLLIGLPFAMSGLKNSRRGQSDDRDDRRSRPARAVARLRGGRRR